MTQLHDELYKLSTGSRFPVDRVMYTYTRNPIVIDRDHSSSLISYDAAGYMILNTIESGPQRLIFSEDLVNPDFSVMSKSTFVSKITKACRYDSLIKTIFENGIPILNQVFFPKIRSDLSEIEIHEIINYHSKCDPPEQNSIEMILSKNGVYKIPIIRDFNENYSTTLNGLKPLSDFTILEDGWFYYGKIIKKQLIAA